MIVSVADLVLISVGKLALDPVSVVATTVQLGTQQVAKTVSSLPSFVANLMKCLINGIFGLRTFPIIPTRECDGVTPCYFPKL